MAKERVFGKMSLIKETFIRAGTAEEPSFLIEVSVTSDECESWRDEGHPRLNNYLQRFPIHLFFGKKYGDSIFYIWDKKPLKLIVCEENLPAKIYQGILDYKENFGESPELKRIKQSLLKAHPNILPQSWSNALWTLFTKGTVYNSH